MKVAAYDIGSHSTRLLIAEIKNNQVIDIVRETTVTRLGEGIANKVINEEATRRTASVLKKYKQIVDKIKVDKSAVVATSAVRDAKNTDFFNKQVQEATRIKPSIISGQKEGELTFAGVCSALNFDERDKNILVIDIGGGSTELIMGKDCKIIKNISMDNGCLRMKEQFLKSDPPLLSEIHLLRKYMQTNFAADIEPFRDKFEIVIAVAGTATSLAAVKLGLTGYDRNKIHKFELSDDDVIQLNLDLSVLNLEQRKQVLGMEPHRADVIIAGGVILELLIDFLNIPKIIVFESDILDGIALSLAYCP